LKSHKALAGNEKRFSDFQNARNDFGDFFARQTIAGRA